MGEVTARTSEIVERIGREGPIAFDAFVELALYGEGGFFTRARGAGRAGRDFVTSPEVGPLFGALVARRARRLVARRGGARSVPRDRGRRGPRPARRATCSRRARRARARCATCWSSARRVCAPRSATCSTVEPFEDALGPMVRDDEDAPVPVDGHGSDRHRARRPPRGGARRRRVRQRAARQPPVPDRRAARRRVVGGAGRADGDAPGRERRARGRASSRPRPTSWSRTRPTARASRCRPRSSSGCARARSRCAAAGSSSSTTPRPAAELVARGAAGLAAHLPRPRARASRRSRRPASRTSPSTCRASTWCTRPTRVGFHLERDIDPGRVAARARDRRPRRRGARPVGRPRPRRRPRGGPSPQPRHRGRGARRPRRARRPPRARLPTR